MIDRHALGGMLSSAGSRVALPFEAQVPHASLAMDQEAQIRAKFEALASVMDERLTRLWVAAEARAVGPGGPAVVERATGIRSKRIYAGLRDLDALSTTPPTPAPGRPPVRRPGGGRKRLTEKDPTLRSDLESLIEPLTRGDPESPLRWTCKSTRRLAAELQHKNHQVSAGTVGNLLWELGYRLHANVKTREGDGHPDRNAQFEHINARADAFLERGEPVISVDTKKKELVGDFKNGGREWAPSGEPVAVRVHDFPDPALGKAIPYGVYDIGRNEGSVNVGTDHDTAAFAVASIAQWWNTMGRLAYPQEKELLITADAGGSNSYRNRLWKVELQAFADRTGLVVNVCHFPPGTSKWNKIEHRLFSHISQNWRGRPLIDHETIVEVIGATTSRTGLGVRATLDRHPYPKGVKVSKAEMRALAVEKDAFHGEWNYRFVPRSKFA